MNNTLSDFKLLNKSLVGESFADGVLLAKYRMSIEGVNLAAKSFSKGRIKIIFSRKGILILLNQKQFENEGEWIVSLFYYTQREELWIGLKRKTAWIKNPFTQTIKIPLFFK